MKIVFMGTPEYSVPVLEMLIENTINIITKSKSKDNSKDSINTSV